MITPITINSRSTLGPGVEKGHVFEAWRKTQGLSSYYTFKDGRMLHLKWKHDGKGLAVLKTARFL